MRDSRPWIRSRPLLLACIGFATLVPNLLWIALDKTAWPWDQAWYGKHSVELFFKLLYSPTEWPRAMLRVLGRNGPGIVWFGQFFVPVGLAIRSIDTGLLLSIVLSQAVALALTSVAVWELGERKFRIAIVGMAAMASAPLFVALSHYYLAEMMQTTAVAWFVFIMALASRWNRLQIAAQLSLAASFAMLAKVSSPLYCFGPGLVALYYFARSPGGTGSSDRTGSARTLVTAIVLAAATIAWYALNLRTVIAHVSMASSGAVAELYGKQDRFLVSMKYWLSAIQTDFLSPPLALVVIATIVSAATIAIATHRLGAGRFAVAASVGALQIAAVLSVFSLNANRDDRYLLPVLPYVVLVLSWAVCRLNSNRLIYAFGIAFALQWSHVHAQSLGLIARGVNASVWLNRDATDATSKMLLDNLVARTCAEHTSGFHWNAVGVQLLWLNPPALSYAAAKALAPRHMNDCDFDAIGYYDSDQSRAWTQLMARKITYYIAVDPAVHKTPATAVEMTVNQLNEPILRRVENSGLFQLEQGIDGQPGILIFKRVDRVDHVANGRALSDEGRHQQAIKELAKAAALEPENVEAWANLALAYERAGQFAEAISAGNQARNLDARHYYVNLGLARSLMQQKQWKDALSRAEDAVAVASDVPQRRDALELAANIAFRAGTPSKACAFLQSAADAHASGSIVDDLSRNGCTNAAGNPGSR